MQPEDEQSIPDKIISGANSILRTNLSAEKTIEEVREELIILINQLINNDFHSLVQLLYRIDVSEKKIRLYLNENSGKNAASVIADLIIERQLEKIESRKIFSRKNDGTDQEEKW